MSKIDLVDSAQATHESAVPLLSSFNEFREDLNFEWLSRCYARFDRNDLGRWNDRGGTRSRMDLSGRLRRHLSLGMDPSANRPKVVLVDGQCQFSTSWEGPGMAWRALIQEEEVGESLEFFEDLAIARDGGMSDLGELPELWYNSRYLSCLLLVVFVIYNYIYIIDIDMAIVRSVDQSVDGYLLLEAILNKILPMGHALQHHPIRVVALVELSLLGFLFLELLLNTMQAIFSGGYRRWRAVVQICWYRLPEMSYFSAMKLLQYITPQQASYDLNYILWYDFSVSGLLWFIVSRSLCLIVGLDCFLIRVRESLKFIATADLTVHNVVGAIMLLNQILGVVQIGNTVKLRLYRFVFGGDDGIFTRREKIRQYIWEAMAMRMIFKKYDTKKAFALALSFCDDDFQMLMLTETASHDTSLPPRSLLAPSSPRRDYFERKGCPDRV